MKNKRGFTLIEMIIALAVVTLVLGGLITVFRVIMKSNQTEQNYISAQDTLRTVSIHLEKEIRTSSQNIEISSLNNCTDIKDLTSNELKTYCLISDGIYFNNTLLINNVKSFDLIKVDNAIELKLESNFQEDVIVYEKTIYLR